MKKIGLVLWIPAALVTIALVGCGESTEPEGLAPASDRTAAAQAALPQPSAEALAILAKADRFDGREDKTIGKCLSCSLAMAGDSKYASTFGPYQLYLCSDKCKEHFEAEPEKVVLTAKLPAAAQ